MSAKVIFSKGARRPASQRGLAPATMQALSHRIMREVQQEVLPGQLEQVAKEKRLEVSHMAQAYFSAMVKGSKELVNNSGVPAEFQPAPMVENKRFVRRKDKIKARGRYPRGNITATIRQVQPLRYPGGAKMESTPTVANVVFSVRWKKLTERYFKRKPRSTRFYYKRTGQDSARLAFNAEVETWKSRVQRLSSYQKAQLRKKSYDAGKGVMTIEFTVNYPTLGHRFDFLRRAFVSGMSRTSALAGLDTDNASNGTGPEGIVFAEHFRPMMRPYAREMGLQFKNALGKLGRKL
jgi:hypothetical protein